MLKQYPTARFILMRAGWYFVTFLVAVTINFYLPRLGPNNPVDIIMAQAGSGTSREDMRIKEEMYLMEFGLVKMKASRDAGGRAVKEMVRDAEGKPVRASNFEQFITYLGMCLKGDLGTSFYKQSKKVTDVIKEAVPWTIALQLPTILFGWIVGNLLGALAAYRRGVFDKVFFPVALGLSSFPFFVFGMLLVAFFALTLGWFPPMGGYDNAIPGFNWPFLSSAAHHYVLPFFSIFLILAGGQAIGMRSMGIYELGTDYIKYAKWLGLRETTVLLYLFRNAMLPQITGLALSLGTMIGGALITEMIFSYPGLGMAMLDAVTKNDYPVIQGVTLIITVSVLIANFTVDILIAFLDPRVKAGVQMGKGL
ncbi:MAG: ABC transporter permease [Chitinispirillia bacterium]|nr:ABC transporter permease [Chitinispirillia bacterium]MCL2242096.1 ABC transporter permease [Chitinispirillia bacterium]